MQWQISDTELLAPVNKKTLKYVRSSVEQPLWFQQKIPGLKFRITFSEYVWAVYSFDRKL